MSRIEGEGSLQKKPKIEFGQPLKKRQDQGALFPEGDDLPLFSGTPQEVIDQPFVPEDNTWKQPLLPGMPEIDYDAVLERDKGLRRRKRKQGIAPAGDIFVASPPEIHEPPTNPKPDQNERGQKLREAIAPYLHVPSLRRLASDGAHLHEALISPNPPKEVLALLDTLATILRPVGREQITSPSDIAALLMVEMGHLTQEQLRVVCLNTKNYVQKIHLVYQGNLNSSPVRIAEVFREPIKLNSAAIITAHNHPSTDPTPSPEDVVVTRQFVEAGNLLGIECLDHLVIGQGRWVSLRERRLGFDT